MGHTGSHPYLWMWMTTGGWTWLLRMIRCRIFFIETSTMELLRIKAIFPASPWMEKDEHTRAWELRREITTATGKWTFIFPRFRTITTCCTATTAMWDLPTLRQRQDLCGRRFHFLAGALGFWILIMMVCWTCL